MQRITIILSKGTIMKTYKNFFASGIIGAIWIGLFVITEFIRFTHPGWFLLLCVIGVLATYGMLRLLEYIPDVLERRPSKAHTRRSRVENWLNSLDDTELEALRERLRDDEPVNTLEDLLADDYPKRKNR
jgi:hypothetical protein